MDKSILFSGVYLHFIRIGKNAYFLKLLFRTEEKFILFDSFLGVGENLLLEFWSPFNFLFVSFSAREIC